MSRHLPQMMTQTMKSWMQQRDPSSCVWFDGCVKGKRCEDADVVVVLVVVYHRRLSLGEARCVDRRLLGVAETGQKGV